MYWNRSNLHKVTVFGPNVTIDGIYNESTGMVYYRPDASDAILATNIGYRVHTGIMGHDVTITQYEAFGDTPAFTHLSVDLVTSPRWIVQGETIWNIPLFYHDADIFVRLGMKKQNLDEKDNADLCMARDLRVIGDYFLDIEIFCQSVEVV